MECLEPAILTIFGITGDLSRRKLLPALYHLAHDELLPETIKIVGISRRGTTTDDVLSTMKLSVEASGGARCKKEVLAFLKERISIVDMDITDEKQYTGLKKQLDSIETTTGICMSRLFYLAIPSTLFGSVIKRLGKHDLNKGCQHGKAHSRLMIEKPFGYDLKSAKNLISQLQESFTEEQVYRIDHYLAKETVQNILTFRFQNPILNNSWDNGSISHIMVTAAESIGIEGRVAFYEQIGALRDLIQSHLLQVVALITMDEPKDMSSKEIHRKKAELLNAIKPPNGDQMETRAIRAQYASYKKEVKKAKTTSETYAAVHLSIDNERWRDVPILIRTGKSLADKVTEITIVYRDTNNTERTNTLTLRIQPSEGIVLDLKIKKPGFEEGEDHVQMDFCYTEQMKVSHPDAYERVIVDAMRGDKTLFATSEEVLASWRITEPILDAWQSNLCKMNSYKNGSWGPKAADKLATSAGTEWMTDTLHICSVHLPDNRSGEK